MVVNVVDLEPVSVREFAANREKNREFYRKPPARCDFCALTASKFRGLQRNSLLNDTGNFCEGAGNLHARTGTLNEL
jgi:hypothetical protein